MAPAFFVNMDKYKMKHGKPLVGGVLTDTMNAIICLRSFGIRNLTGYV